MKLKITVHGVAYEVDVQVLDAKDEMAAATGSPLPPPVVAAPPGATPPARVVGGPPDPAAAGAVASPIAGTVLEVKCKPGDQVAQGQDLLVIEAMKMETAISAPAAGTIRTVAVAAGDSVRENQTLVEFQ